MGLVTNEQTEKRPGQFIKLEDKSVLSIMSNLYKTTTHFLKSKNVSVICKGEDCYFCQMNHKARPNYFYWGLVGSEEGVVQVPASVFYAINEQERVLDMDKKDSLWVISKQGSGMSTKYGVARGKDAPKPSKTLEEANKLLSKVCDSFVENNTKRYGEMVKLKVVEEPEQEQENS